MLVDDKTKFNGKKKLADLVAGDRLNVQGYACKADVAAGSLLARKVNEEIKGPKRWPRQKATTTATIETVTSERRNHRRVLVAVRHRGHAEGAARRPRSFALSLTPSVYFDRSIRPPPRLLLAVRGLSALPFWVAPTTAVPPHLPTELFSPVAIREAVTT